MKMADSLQNKLEEMEARNPSKNPHPKGFIGSFFDDIHFSFRDKKEKVEPVPQQRAIYGSLDDMYMDCGRAIKYFLDDVNVDSYSERFHHLHWALNHAFCQSAIPYYRFDPSSVASEIRAAKIEAHELGVGIPSMILARIYEIDEITRFEWIDRAVRICHDLIDKRVFAFDPEADWAVPHVKSHLHDAVSTAQDLDSEDYSDHLAIAKRIAYGHRDSYVTIPRQVVELTKKIRKSISEYQTLPDIL